MFSETLGEWKEVTPCETPETTPSPAAPPPPQPGLRDWCIPTIVRASQPANERAASLAIEQNFLRSLRYSSCDLFFWCASSLWSLPAELSSSAADGFLVALRPLFRAVITHLGNFVELTLLLEALFLLGGAAVRELLPGPMAPTWALALTTPASFSKPMSGEMGLFVLSTAFLVAFIRVDAEQAELPHRWLVKVLHTEPLQQALLLVMPLLLSAASVYLTRLSKFGAELQDWYRRSQGGMKRALFPNIARLLSYSLFYGAYTRSFNEPLLEPETAPRPLLFCVFVDFLCQWLLPYFFREGDLPSDKMAALRIVELMHAHPDDVHVAENGARALISHLKHSSSAVKPILAAAVDALVTAIKNPKASAVVVECSCEALRFILWSPAAKAAKQPVDAFARRLLLAENAAGAIVSALNSHSKEGYVFNQACLLLHVIALENSDGKEACVQAGAIKAITSALSSDTPLSLSFQTNALWALRKVTSLDIKGDWSKIQNFKDLVYANESGCARVILDLLRRAKLKDSTLGGYAAFKGAACVVLYSLAVCHHVAPLSVKENSTSLEREPLDAGIEIIAALKECMVNENFAQRACLALAEIARIHGGVRKVVAESALEEAASTVEATLRIHLKDQLCGAAVDSFKTLLLFPTNLRCAQLLAVAISTHSKLHTHWHDAALKAQKSGSASDSAQLEGGAGATPLVAAALAQNSGPASNAAHQGGSAGASPAAANQGAAKESPSPPPLPTYSQALALLTPLGFWTVKPDAQSQKVTPSQGLSIALSATASFPPPLLRASAAGFCLAAIFPPPYLGAIGASCLWLFAAWLFLNAQGAQRAHPPHPHPLSPVKDGRESSNCDLCGKGGAENGPYMSCAPCNYDECSSCFPQSPSAALSKAPAAQGALAEESEEDQGGGEEEDGGGGGEGMVGWLSFACFLLSLAYLAFDLHLRVRDLYPQELWPPGEGPPPPDLAFKPLGAIPKWLEPLPVLCLFVLFRGAAFGQGAPPGAPSDLVLMSLAWSLLKLHCWFEWRTAYNGAMHDEASGEALRESVVALSKNLTESLTSIPNETGWVTFKLSLNKFFSLWSGGALSYFLKASSSAAIKSELSADYTLIDNILKLPLDILNFLASAEMWDFASQLEFYIGKGVWGRIAACSFALLELKRCMNVKKIK